MTEKAWHRKTDPTRRRCEWCMKRGHTQARCEMAERGERPVFVDYAPPPPASDLGRVVVVESARHRRDRERVR